MENIIIIGILLVIVGASVLYIWKEKKKGARCIGCPAAGGCRTNGCQKDPLPKPKEHHKM